MLNRFNVEVGQSWQDCDKRMNRSIKIVRIEGDYAYGAIGLSGKQTRIRLDRFKPNATGWRLVRGVK